MAEHPKGPGGGHVFEITGGNLALDLANTVDERPTTRRVDHLESYGDLVSWAVQTGTISEARGNRLRRAASERPAAAQGVLRRAVRLREAIFALFSSVASGEKPPAKPLGVLNDLLPAALARLRLSAADGGFAWSWDWEGEPMELPLWPVVRAAADLLSSDRLDRVRLCAADRCDWLFLDTSRNRSRRWCDMNVCGNRHKARSFYRRSRGS